ncbi:MAG: heparinase II/III family protein [Knoellia sp.]
MLSNRNRTVRRCAAVTIASAIAIAGLAPSSSADRNDPLPSPKKAMSAAKSSVDKLDEVPGMTPAKAVRLGLEAADQTATAYDTAGCAKLKVISSKSGTGASTRISIVGSTASWTVGAVPASWYSSPPTTAPVWNLYFRGFYWASELAPAFLAAGDTAGMEALIVSASKFHVVNPDKGTSVNGWDEGTNLRREEALNCLYRASGGDARLVPAIQAAAKANMDMNRYYGLPNHQPHNHGAMANLALIDSADLLGRSDWRIYAANRLVRDSGGVWTQAGLTFEQSAAYHHYNSAVWSDIADLLATYPEAEMRTAAGQIKAYVAKARGALSHLTTPDGKLIGFGDGVPTAFQRTAQPSGTFRDDQAGVLTGRWSWTDPNTSFYLLRYGGPRRLHGHEERTSLVWSTEGVPVLIDPGTFSYDPGIYTTFSKTPIGHNSQLVRNRTFVPGNGVFVSSRSSSGSVHGMVTSDSQYGVAHTRSWRVDNANRMVTLSDTVAGVATTTAHLDSRWVLMSTSPDGKKLTYSDGNGRLLVVTGTFPLKAVKGSTNPVLGWQFPKMGQRSHASQILMYPTAGTSGMTFKVFGQRDKKPSAGGR